MIVTVEDVRFVGCRVVVGEDGKEKTYGNLYTKEGDLLPFSCDYEVQDSLNGAGAKLDITWGSGKNGKWVRCVLL